MRMMKKMMCVVAAATLLIAGTAGCGTSEKKVATDGSTSMEKVIGALGEAFMENNDGVDYV